MASSKSRGWLSRQESDDRDPLRQPKNLGNISQAMRGQDGFQQETVLVSLQLRKITLGTFE